LLAEINTEVLRAAYKRALRNKTYFRLSLRERAILKISFLFFKRIKSEIVREALLKILDKVWPSMAFKIRALEVGFSLLRKRVEIALKLGYRRAKAWLNDLNFAFYLGVSSLNAPPYR